MLWLLDDAEDDDQPLPTGEPGRDGTAGTNLARHCRLAHLAPAPAPAAQAWWQQASQELPALLDAAPDAVVASSYKVSGCASGLQSAQPLHGLSTAAPACASPLQPRRLEPTRACLAARCSPSRSGARRMLPRRAPAAAASSRAPWCADCILALCPPPTATATAQRPLSSTTPQFSTLPSLHSTGAPCAALWQARVALSESARFPPRPWLFGRHGALRARLCAG